MATTELTEQLWVEGLASRLKLLQVTCADQTPAQRREYLAEEIGRALKEVPPSRRSGHLAALSVKFPAWQTPMPTPLNESPQLSTAEPTPEVILDRLLQTLPQWTDETRKVLVRKLTEGGVIKAVSPASTGEPGEEIRQLLGLPAGKPLEWQRVAKLLALLNRMLATLDNLAWEAWSKLSPRSEVKREAAAGGPLANLTQKYLSGDPEPTDRQLASAAEKSRKLIAAWLGGLPIGLRAYAEEYQEKFLPRNIEDVTGSRGSSFFGESMEKKCWSKYKELSYPDTASIEKKIKDAIAKGVEQTYLSG